MSRTRIPTAIAAAALTISVMGVEAGAATVDRQCAVSLTREEAAYARMLFDESKLLQDHETARDLIAAVDTVYPGVMEITERGLKGDNPDREAYAKLGMPTPLIDAYLTAQTTLSTTEPTTDVTLEDIDTSKLKAEAKPAKEPMFPVEGLDAKLKAELTDAWLETPTGKHAKAQYEFDKANAKAAELCASGKAGKVDFPKASPETSPEPNIAAIVGGVIAAVLAIAGIIAALPMLPKL